MHVALISLLCLSISCSEYCPPHFSAQVDSAYAIGLCLVIASQMYTPDMMKMHPSWQKRLYVERDRKKKKRTEAFNSGIVDPLSQLHCLWHPFNDFCNEFFKNKTHFWLHTFVLKINILFPLLLINHWVNNCICFFNCFSEQSCQLYNCKNVP